MKAGGGHLWNILVQTVVVSAIVVPQCHEETWTIFSYIEYNFLEPNLHVLLLNSGPMILHAIFSSFC